MGFYAFGLLMIGCVFFLTIDAVDAIQCHQCSYTEYFGSSNGDAKCKDPFDSTDIAVVECSGQCYANHTYISSVGEEFHRGCAANTGIVCEAFQGCQEMAETLACLYCCDTDNCNSQGLREFDESLLKCYHCVAFLDANGMPVDNSSTCGRADFDGTGFDVIKFSCKPGTSNCFTQIAVNGIEGGSRVITRSCAQDEVMDLCQNKALYESLGNIKIDCCTDNLCNVGTPSLDFEPPVTREPRPAIDCYFCEANLTAEGLPVDQSSCGRTDFDGSGQDVILLPCDTGICVTLYEPLMNDAQLVRRACAPQELLTACDNPAILSIAGIRAECCYKDGCNTVNLLMTDSDGTATTAPDSDGTATTATENLGDTMTTSGSGADGVAMFAASSSALLMFSTVFFTYRAVV